jgi:uncharacterized metal-binding protein
MADNCSCCGAPQTLIFACSGGSDCGQLSDAVARKLTKDGKGKMYCLAGIGGHVSGIIESTKAAKKVVTIDGCPVMCAKKTLEHAGFIPWAFSLKDFGFEKGKTLVNETTIQETAGRMDV